MKFLEFTAINTESEPTCSASRLIHTESVIELPNNCI